MDSLQKGEILVQGMILRSVPQGDYDKRLVILTKEKGRITAFAKGARRSKNLLAGKTNPFAFGNFVLGTGSSAYYLKRADISNYFMEMGQDFERNCYGCYLLEFVEYYTREGSSELPMLKLLYQSIRALINDSIPNELVRCIFELKATVLNGEYPEVFHCLKCRKPLQEAYFVTKKGGAFCKDCRQKTDEEIYIDGTVLYTMQYVISTDIEKLYTFVVKDEVLRKFRKIMTSYCRHFIDKEFMSLTLFDDF